MKITNLLYIIVFSLLSHKVDGQRIAPIEISNQLPELQLNNILGQDSKRVALSEFKGRLVLIDFWATWCSPCVSVMPLLDSLQSQFTQELQIICVATEDEKAVKAAYSRIFRNKQPEFLTVIQDTLMGKYFPHQTIPHCVWIDKKGIVKAITDKESVSMSGIKRMLNGDLSQMINKPKLKRLDLHKPPYASKQLNFEDEFLYHSLITKYREDIPANYSRGRRNEYIACTNSSIIRLYQCAAGKFNLSWLDMNRVVCQGFTTFADSASIGLFASDQLVNSWRSNIKDYAFTYELAVPDSVYSTEQLFSIMFEDLNRYFAAYGLSAVKKMGSHKVLALTSMTGSNFKSFKDSTGHSEKYSDSKFLKVVNHPMSYLLSQLKPYLPTEYPLVNQTAYEGMVSIELEMENRSLSNMNKALSIYGLQLEEKEEPIEVLVITKVQGKKRFP